jgi:hypothetical protein
MFMGSVHITDSALWVDSVVGLKNDKFLEKNFIWFKGYCGFRFSFLGSLRCWLALRFQETLHI